MFFQEIVFPIAGIKVAPFIPPLVAFIISFFTSMGGVSGAFLLLPYQVSFLGYTNPSVSATNQVFNIVAIPSGVYRYCKEGRMLWPLTAIIIIGTLPGVFIGAYARVAYLPDPAKFKLFAGFVLLYIGVKMVVERLKKPVENDTSCVNKSFQEMQDKQKNSLDSGNSNLSLEVKVTHFSLKRLSYVFYGETFSVSFWSVFTLSFIVGIVGGTYGIGGGAIIAPFLITSFRLPVYTVAGSALMGTFVTSIAGVIFYHIIAPFYPEMSVNPDWKLGILFGIGGMAGIYLGARCQKFVPSAAIKWMLAIIIIFTGIKYIYDFFM